MTLEAELKGEEGSFIFKLRVEHKWNHISFINLIEKVYEKCELNEEQQVLNRHIASSIWYMSGYIKEYSSHENFPKPYPSGYYDKSYSIIHDLAYYYFFGESPYQSKNTLVEKINEIKVFFD